MILYKTDKEDLMLKDFEKTKPEDKSVLNAEIKELSSTLMGMQEQLRG